MRRAITLLAVLAALGFAVGMRAEDESSRSVPPDVARPASATSDYYKGPTREELAAASDRSRIEELLELAESPGLDILPALPIQRFELPAAGIDLMRARVVETYEIFGVGTDTVELEGWIAVRHGNPRAAAGFSEVEWETAVIATEFVALDLRGTSEIFGPVRVRLDPDRRSRGKVGAITMPATQAEALERVASLGSDGVEPPMPSPSPMPRPCARTCDCQAALAAVVELSDLGLEMATKYPVLMHSEVETIPPVGYTSTVSLIPVPLMHGDREVGVLHHAEVKFREIVGHRALAGDPS
jgi:hypothetical protein